jgi:hypothetical protein
LTTRRVQNLAAKTADLAGRIGIQAEGGAEVLVKLPRLPLRDLFRR